jgi:acyl-CoA thioesterase
MLPNLDGQSALHEGMNFIQEGELVAVVPQTTTFKDIKKFWQLIYA